MQLLFTYLVGAVGEHPRVPHVHVGAKERYHFEVGREKVTMLRSENKLALGEQPLADIARWGNASDKRGRVQSE